MSSAPSGRQSLSHDRGAPESELSSEDEPTYRGDGRVRPSILTKKTTVHTPAPKSDQTQHRGLTLKTQKCKSGHGTEARVGVATSDKYASARKVCDTSHTRTE